MQTLPRAIQEKIDAFVELCTPDDVVVCSGTREEYQGFLDTMESMGVAKRLKNEGCYYFRSDPKDVARVESCTFICSERKEDAGPTNNHEDPEKMKARLDNLFKGCMVGRTMYVIPYLMGPPQNPMAKVGIEVTDSMYVCVNMYIMARMGSIALKRIDEGADPVIGLHSVGMPLPEGKEDVAWPCNREKVIAHFPETREIFSFGSGYGGNALLGKKCFALRIASTMAKEEGWLAEHMLVIGVTNPEGQKKYFAAAFPSQCGKTNLAMIKPNLPGWKVECVGDDIAWMQFHEDGRLYAINPENGFFGVAPGTSEKTNPYAIEIIAKDTLFTNVALHGDDVWWEGKTREVPDGLINWKGEKHDKNGEAPASHPNARFTAPLARCPNLDPATYSERGVPIEGIIFGGRRESTIPLVMEAKDWTQGTFYGAALSSEKTAAAEGKTGELRHDPFAMLPFCGYHMGDYFAHFLAQEKEGRHMPKIFSVNWFRKDGDGKFIWPGFGENMHVLAWMFDAIEGVAERQETPFGFVPKSLPVEVDGLEQILSVEEEEMAREVAANKEYLTSTFGDRCPEQLL